MASNSNPRRKAVRWSDALYVKGLKAIRASNHFVGFGVSDGYDLRKKTGFTPSQKKAIKKHLRILTVINSKPHAFIKPKTKTAFTRARKALGFHTTKLKAIPFPVIPGAKKVRIEINKANWVTVSYIDRNLRQIVFPIDVKKIIKRVDLTQEETEIKDEMASAIIEEIEFFVDAVDDGSTVFRLHTSSGDINPAAFKPAMNAQIMLDHVPKLINKYFDPAQGTELFITGFSAWQRIKPTTRLWPRPELTDARHDFTAVGRPRSKGGKRSAREKATGRK